MQVNKVPAGLWPALFLNNLHCRAFCPAVKLRAHARNEIRHYRDGLNPVITGLNCPASAGQYFIPINRHLQSFWKCPNDYCGLRPPGVTSSEIDFIGQQARVSERNSKARETGDITIASGAAATAAKPLVLV